MNRREPEMREGRVRLGLRLREQAVRAIASRRVFPYLALATLGVSVAVGFLVRLLDPNEFDSVGEGIWWAVVTLGTVGYGDVVPHSTWGRVLGGLVIAFGVTFLAFLMATVTSLFVSADQREEAARASERDAATAEEMRGLLRQVAERLDAIEAKLERGPPDR